MKKSVTFQKYYRLNSNLKLKKKKKTGKNKTILWAPLTYPWKPIHYEEKGGKQPPDSLHLWKNHCINN